MSLAASKKQTFEELTVGHTFKYGQKDARLSGIDEDHFHCALCGGKGRQAHTVVRDDGVVLKVGTTCLQRIGLFPPDEPKVVKPKAAPKKTELKPVDPEPVVEVKPASEEPSIDDLFDDVEGKK